MKYWKYTYKLRMFIRFTFSIISFPSFRKAFFSKMCIILYFPSQWGLLNQLSQYGYHSTLFYRWILLFLYLISIEPYPRKPSLFSASHPFEYWVWIPQQGSILSICFSQLALVLGWGSVNYLFSGVFFWFSSPFGIQLPIPPSIINSNFQSFLAV